MPTKTVECRDAEYMPQAVVSVRLGLWLSKMPDTPEVTIALDRMHVLESEYLEHSTGRTVATRAACNLDELLPGWVATPYLKPWGKWTKADSTIYILAAPGPDDKACDVEAPLSVGKLRVDCKQVKSAVQEQTQLQAGIGELVTIRDFNATDLFAVAVPYSRRLAELASRFLSAPIFGQTGIAIALVHNHGPVTWLTPDTEGWRAFKKVAGES